ncbi:AAA family ATPase [Psychromonas hadalis]|uniref:AAA family ATPase n=1 Tax=Psychromonas hadalis TaxID=211669 RepID=UPI0003B66592|nr:AAA family ATPase [Psychromonas hadalis]
MSNYLYVTAIKALEHPYIKQKYISVLISGEKRKNIIITGKNGCGKSTLLRSIKANISSKGKTNNQYQVKLNTYLLKMKSIQRGTPEYIQLEKQVEAYRDVILTQGSAVTVTYSDINLFNQQDSVLAYFEAKRMTNLSKPQHISAPKLTQEAIGLHTAGATFIHHLVNRRSQLAFANEDNEAVEAQAIRNWFDNLDSLFSELFEKKVKLKFLRNELDYTLEAENGEIIDLKLLSDGYSAVVNMITEIIIRMEAISFGRLDIGGIVLIDEIETHLHVSLQRQILPFLNSMFPNIQFIVTTHSPFVLSSVDDAIIYDLESGDTIDQEQALWAHSYEAL